MIACQGFVLLFDEAYSVNASTSFELVLAKFVCSSALHIMLYPEIARGMGLRKYVGNHHELFTNPAAVTAIAFTNNLIQFFTEALCIYLLSYQHTVEHCIVHFVALEILVELPHFYSNSLVDDKLKERIFSKLHHLHIHNKSKDIDFWKDRSLLSKFSRVNYKIFRAFYVSVIFYF